MNEAGYLTTHVLDTANGCPAAGMGVDLFQAHGDHAHLIRSIVTNCDGRSDKPLLIGADFAEGAYELHFNVGPYFAKKGMAVEEPFLNVVPVHFIVSDRSAHYHVPLLVSPFGYSTYRGS